MIADEEITEDYLYGNLERKVKDEVVNWYAKVDKFLGSVLTRYTASPNPLPPLHITVAMHHNSDPDAVSSGIATGWLIAEMLLRKGQQCRITLATPDSISSVSLSLLKKVFFSKGKEEDLKLPFELPLPFRAKEVRFMFTAPIDISSADALILVD
ncbi:MAG: hypothetical protein QW728_05460, partial [Thermoplasmata archaeon]